MNKSEITRLANRMRSIANKLSPTNNFDEEGEDRAIALAKEAVEKWHAFHTTMKRLEDAMDRGDHALWQGVQGFLAIHHGRAIDEMFELPGFLERSIGIGNR